MAGFLGEGILLFLWKMPLVPIQNGKYFVY